MKIQNSEKLNYENTNTIFFWTGIGKNQEDLITFLEGQDVSHGSSQCALELN